MEQSEFVAIRDRLLAEYERLTTTDDAYLTSTFFAVNLSDRANPWCGMVLDLWCNDGTGADPEVHAIAHDGALLQMLLVLCWYRYREGVLAEEHAHDYH